jgi:hypothetical protein
MSKAPGASGSKQEIAFVNLDPRSLSVTFFIYCKALYFHEPFIFANAVSNADIKGAKISTPTHYALNFHTKRII